MRPEPGSVHRGPYPFIRKEYTYIDMGGPVDAIGWCPGVIQEQNRYREWATAHGMGEIVLTVVDVFKPGKYPARVFYTRQWADPTGHLFGKGKLWMTTVQNFRQLAKGYRHDFEVSAPPTEALPISTETPTQETEP